MESSGFQKKIISLSVSDVVDLFKCPMQVYFRKKGHKAHFRYSYSYYIGVLLHEILAEFVKQVKNLTLFETNIDFSEQEELSRYIEKSLYRILISKMKKTSYSKSYFDVAWDHLKVMANYFAYLTTKNKASFSDIFLFTEESFKFNISDSIAIRGRFDLLIADSNSLRLIDYKTRDEDFRSDIVQVSIYANAMSAKFGRKVEPMVLYVRENMVQERKLNEREVDLVYGQVLNEVIEFEKVLTGAKEARKTYDKSFCKKCTASNFAICKQEEIR